MCELSSEEKVDLIEMYKIFKDYADKENQLLGQRTTWFVTIQSVLIATIGFSLQRIFDVTIKLGEKDLSEVVKMQIIKINNYFEISLGLFCSIGFFTSFITYLSVKSAIDAQRALEQDWRSNFYEKAKQIRIPFIAGGGDTPAVYMGDWLALAIPVLMSVIWPATMIAIYAGTGSIFVLGCTILTSVAFAAYLVHSILMAA